MTALCERCGNYTDICGCAEAEALAARLAEAIECCTIKDNRNLWLEIRLKKIMARCADLLDEDQFNELDAMTRATDSAPAVTDNCPLCGEPRADHAEIAPNGKPECRMKCKRCGDTGWLQGDPILGISDEPCGCDENWEE